MAEEKANGPNGPSGITADCSGHGANSGQTPRRRWQFTLFELVFITVFTGAFLGLNLLPSNLEREVSITGWPGSEPPNLTDMAVQQLAQGVNYWGIERVDFYGFPLPFLWKSNLMGRTFAFPLLLCDLVAFLIMSFGLLWVTRVLRQQGKDTFQPCK